MAVLLSRPYLGNAAGVVAVFPASTESAIVAQGLGTVSAAVPTAGAFATSMTRGFATIATGASSVVVTNPNVDITSSVNARVAQTAADTTLLRVERVVPAAGSFTIFGTANATAPTVVSWDISNGNPNPFN
jgi:hypothetical protein